EAQLLDAKMVDQAALQHTPVIERKNRKLHTIGLAGFGVDRRWPGCNDGRAVEVDVADAVLADDEIFVGVDGFAGADQAVPPARCRVGFVVAAGCMAGTGKIVTDENSVVFAFVELSVSFIPKTHRNSFFAMQKSVFARIKPDFFCQHPRFSLQNLRNLPYFKTCAGKNQFQKCCKIKKRALIKIFV
ncbi:MAG TPA: hypothetical protein PKC25_02420, partial [Candidatus Rifleibacterium sp.]|nr:hypothetical protein [Candidatus Rifleibacterium sp.]